MGHIVFISVVGIAVLDLLFVLCACKVSGRISRLEEQATKIASVKLFVCKK